MTIKENLHLGRLQRLLEQQLPQFVKWALNAAADNLITIHCVVRDVMEQILNVDEGMIQRERAV